MQAAKYNTDSYINYLIKRYKHLKAVRTIPEWEAQHPGIRLLVGNVFIWTEEKTYGPIAYYKRRSELNSWITVAHNKRVKVQRQAKAEYEYWRKIYRNLPTTSTKG